MTELKKYLSTLPEFSTTSSRLSFLYSSLAPRKSANPTGFSSAIGWWRLLLLDLVAKGHLGEDKLILVADDTLREALRWDKIGRPSSLGTILSELSQASEVVPLDAYLASTGPPTSSWLRVIALPLRWSLSLARSKILGEPELGEAAEEAEWRTRNGDWVLKELVERSATRLIPKLNDLHVDPISRLYTIKTFQSTISKLCLPGVELSERDCAVVAKYLSNQGLCVVSDQVIKFAPPTSSTTRTTITESDCGILTLLTTLASLTAYIKSIELRIVEQTDLMKSYHLQRQLGLVKSHLISRKRLEVLLSERVGARDKLSEVLFGIEKATGDEETIAALTLGTKTLRLLISSPTLSLNHIDETTSAMSEALADADDINSAIKDGNIGLGSAQEEEVESEWAEMVREAEKVEEEEKVRKEKERMEKAAAALAASSVPSVPLPVEEKAEEKEVEEEEKSEVLA